MIAAIIVAQVAVLEIFDADAIAAAIASSSRGIIASESVASFSASWTLPLLLCSFWLFLARLSAINADGSNAKAYVRTFPSASFALASPLWKAI